MAKGIKLRNWSLDARDYQTEDEFLAAVEMEAAKSVHLQERLGVAIVSTPIKQVVNGEYVTLGWHFATATVPAARQSEPDPVVEEELEQIVEEPAPLSEEELQELDEAVAELDEQVADDPYAES